MYDTDCSKFGEFFYKEVGTPEASLELESFIKTAFSIYVERFSASKHFPGKTISFSSEISKLLILVTPETNSFDITGLRINSETTDLSSLLNVLRGNLTADFLELSIEDTGLQREIEKSKDKNYVHTRNLGIYLSPRQGFVKTIKLEKIKKGLFQTKKTNSKLEETELDDFTMQLLSSADKILVQNNFYLNDNPGNELILEACQILKQEDKYVWTYTVQSASNQFLPTNLLQDWKKVFELIKKSFNSGIFKKAEIKESASFGVNK